ncbi:hypothetical protein AYO21_04433 [Fonsecaea monophora]|uniref:Uncharacterized protein n=1 Tax=Fonsecaea monophora TaxID=254056 RepID=A0A177FCE3_9EURO|nr:hypothetical protein AYO21_04433 [Fonsecaea monophora]OAG41270.1 hypothetical protein AYO21_04433 [Fonsecaea monophora]
MVTKNFDSSVELRQVEEVVEVAVEVGCMMSSPNCPDWNRLALNWPSASGGSPGLFRRDDELKAGTTNTMDNGHRPESPSFEPKVARGHRTSKGKGWSNGLEGDAIPEVENA